MKYFEVDFCIHAPEMLFQDACDLLSAMAGEAGFETFEETGTGLKGYVQQSLFDEQALKEVLTAFPFEEVAVTYTVEEADNQDWNAQWEQEGFEPIVVRGSGEEKKKGPVVIIHDGRHLPADISSFHSDGLSPITIEIDAHLAFGTGTHETTRMMVSSLLEMDLEGKTVLDCGCGTGILGIAALKHGARHCVGYDIDEWSAENARHNAIINGVEEQYTALLGDASVLKEVNGSFDVVMANINRNILLNDMPVFRNKMKPGGHLLLSGFYQQDVPMLLEKAASLDLKPIGQKEEGDWISLRFRL
jgi:ribosomal protein L11 methyltransferase